MGLKLLTLGLFEPCRLPLLDGANYHLPFTQQTNAPYSISGHLNLSMNKHAVFSFFSGTEFLDPGFENEGFDVAFFTRTDLIPA